MTEQNKFNENGLHSSDINTYPLLRQKKLEIELLGNFSYEWLFIM